MYQKSHLIYQNKILKNIFLEFIKESFPTITLLLGSFLYFIFNILHIYSKLSGLSLKVSINLTSSSLKVEESSIPNKSLSDISKNSHILTNCETVGVDLFKQNLDIAEIDVSRYRAKSAFFKSKYLHILLAIVYSIAFSVSIKDSHLLFKCWSSYNVIKAL